MMHFRDKVTIER